MQQVLNLKDRNQAFLKFLLFFLLTLILVVTAVYFNFRLPIRENRTLQEEVSLGRQQDANQEKFAVKMQEAITLLDSLDKSNINREQISNQLSGRLTELSLLQAKDNTQYGRIDKAIGDKLYELQQTKKSMQDLEAKDASLSDLQNQLTNARAELTAANAQLDALRGRSQGFK